MGKHELLHAFVKPRQQPIQYNRYLKAIVVDEDLGKSARFPVVRNRRLSHQVVVLGVGGGGCSDAGALGVHQEWRTGI